MFYQLLFVLVPCLTLTGFLRADEKPSPSAGKSIALLNGKDLDGWRVIEKYDFKQHGEVKIADKAIVMEMGRPATGISWSGKDFPKMNYEVSLEAARLEGSDFFCGMTFPVGEAYLSFIVGGWGGGVVGMSNVDNLSAVENQTTNYTEFKNGKWYAIRLRVTEERIEAWIDDEKCVNLKTAKHKLSIWWEQEPVRPFGFAAWRSKSGLRNIQLKHLDVANAGDTEIEKKGKGIR